MYPNSRIKRKNAYIKNRSNPRREDLVEISPISLNRQEIKLPTLSQKLTSKREPSISFKATPKKSSALPFHSTPSPINNIKSRQSMQSNLSFNLFKKKSKNFITQNSVDITRPLNSISIESKTPEVKKGILKFPPNISENLKKLALNFVHSSSSDLSSSSNSNTKEDVKKFENPALWQATNSITSYVSENSYLKQNSNYHAMHTGALVEENEESPDIGKYNEFKIKVISQDPIFDGIKGRLRQWKVGEMLGIGSYAQVFKAFDINTGEIFAVKRIFFNPNNKPQSKFIKELEAEVEILKGIEHKHVVKYLGSESIHDTFCIYLEYLPGGSLSKLLYNLGALSEMTVRAYLTQILKGLVYLHENGVIHRDIKGANILLDSNGKVKLSDFGCSKQYHSSDAESGFITSVKGSLPWMAPEVITQKGYGRKADIWSVGCVALEMLTAKRPWATDDNHVVFMMKIVNDGAIPDIPDGISHSAKDFLISCFQRDPKIRLSAKQLLNHSFLRKLGNF